MDSESEEVSELSASEEVDSVELTPLELAVPVVTFFVAAGLWWLAAWVWLREDALPGGVVFSFGLVVFASIVGGRLAPFVKMPPLLGMLVCGFILRNLPGDPLRGLYSPTSAVMRSLALAVILVRAGLGLNFRKLIALGGPTIRLAIVPVCVEALTVALLALGLLDLPAAWCFSLGFLVAAVSPAVVVPSLLYLQDNRYGVEKGIPTMVLAAASLDDVVAISGFGVSIGIAFATGSLVWNILHGPIEVLAGAFGGAILGVLCVPLKFSPVPARVSVLVGMGLCCILGGKALGATGAGALATMTAPFVTAQFWGPVVKAPVSALMARVWKVGAEPVLFGLIGAAVDLDNVDPDVVGYGVLILALSLMVRSAATFACVQGGGLTRKEQLFVVAAWLPKATVQAALGPAALDIARELEAGDKAEEYGNVLLTIAVLVIVITAPIGAILIAVLGPRFLTQERKDPAI